MRSGSSTIAFGPRRLSGLGDARTLSSQKFGRAETDMGSPITAMTVVRQLSKSACQSGVSYGFTGSRAWVDKGCRADFDIALSGSGGGGDYATADRNLTTMIQRIQSCQIDPNSAVPSSWLLAPPSGNVTPDVKAAWDSYSLRLNQELPAARQSAGIFCSAGTNNGGVSYGAPYSGQPPGAYGYGTDAYGRPLQSAQSNEPVDIYGSEPSAADIYTPSPGQGASGSNFSDVIANPFAPQPAPVAPPPKKHHTAAIAGGGVAILVIAALLLRKRSSRRSAR